MEKKLFEVIIITDNGKNYDYDEFYEWSYNNAELRAFERAKIIFNNKYDEIIINEISKEEAYKRAWEREHKKDYPY